jgi:hypothetical protein
MNTETQSPELASVLTLLREIEDAKAKLKGIGVLRSDRDAACDFAEWWAAKRCGLKLVTNTVNADYDAEDRCGQKYQIKSRRVTDVDQATSFDFHKVGEFDFLVAVFLARPTLEPLAVYCLPRTFVKAHLSNNLRFRWHRTVRQQAEAAGYGPVRQDGSAESY